MNNTFMNNCKTIFNSLMDQESKFIFEERLLFSCTCDNKHIKNVINSLEEGKKIIDLINSNYDLYIFGAGIWGKELIKVWPNRFKAFIDNNANKWGKKIGDISIISPKKILDNNFSGKVLISTRLYYNEIYKQLLSIGIKAKDIINIGEIQDKLAKKQYFDLPQLNLNEEIFADVGSLDGMTALELIREKDKKFKKVYCFEPDKQNIPKCQHNLKLYIAQGKAFVIPKGCWSFDGKLSFLSQGNGGSTFTLKESIELDKASVDVTRLDTIFEEERVSFVKMDIEGAEIEALKGCKGIIKKYAPKLAICVYHKPEDIYELPGLILKYNPKYKLYLRHYSVTAAETVLYAI